jgi:hypothetical protein
VTSEVLEIPAEEQGRKFLLAGDTGGVKEPAPQLAVAKAMVAAVAQSPDIGFLYHLGDIDYFSGEGAEIGPQFYEAYADFLRHIVGIPGNHDGAGDDDLATFMQTFCTPTPEMVPEWEEFGRDTMDQPNCYWTLDDPAITIIGLYTNVPSGGEVAEDQREWFVGELEAAPKGKPLMVCLHHPPYSVDAHHGGSASMGELLDTAFGEAQRWPNIVASGHVHDYQRFTRTVTVNEVGDPHQITYLVVGNGGYHNLHALASDATPGEEVGSGVKFEYGDASGWGFLTVAVESEDGVDNVIEGSYTQVARDGTVKEGADKFTLTV